MLSLVAAAALAGEVYAGDVYEEPRDLSLNAEGVETLSIRSGAGRLRVEGIPGTGTIVAKALVRVPESDPQEAQRIVRDELVLRLAREGATAVLEARFEGDGDGSVALDVTMPENIALEITDGSGSLEVVNARGPVTIDDGSGAIALRGVGGDVTVNDGSGGLSVEDVGGNLVIEDTSGEVIVREVGGSVRIVDGSGAITVSGVAGDVEIPEAGSGGVEVSDVAGTVRRDE